MLSKMNAPSFVCVEILFDETYIYTIIFPVYVLICSFVMFLMLLQSYVRIKNGENMTSDNTDKTLERINSNSYSLLLTNLKESRDKVDSMITKKRRFFFIYWILLNNKEQPVDFRFVYSFFIK